MTESETAITAPTNREFFLAGKPKVRRLQKAIIVKYNLHRSEFFKQSGIISKATIKGVNEARRAGEMANELAGLLPGGQTTFNFWQQIAGSRKDQLNGTFEEMQTFQWLTRHLTADITTIEEAMTVQQVVKLLQAQQKEKRLRERHDPPDAWALMLNWFDRVDLDATVEKIGSDENYFPGGIPSDTLMDVVREELVPKLKAMVKIVRLFKLEKEVGI